MSLPLTYNSGRCYINAYINKQNHYADKNLKLVIGSLGFHHWDEYGGRNWTLDEFKAKMRTWSSDSHCWLEDDDGKVYDFIFPEYNLISKMRTKKTLDHQGLVEGMTKAELAEKGLVYTPADKATQTALFLHHRTFCVAAVNTIKEVNAMKTIINAKKH